MSRRRSKGIRKKRKLQQKVRKHGPLYRVPFRRRREMKTDYHQRKRLLKSGKIRFVARPSNKQILVQFVESKIGGDKTFIQTQSNDLKKFGWDIATSNLPAAYLTGYLAGKRAVKEKITEVVMAQPDDASYDEILRELAFERMIERGMADVRANRVISDEEMSHRIRTWQN